MRKFQDVIDLEGWEIETDSGYQPVSSIMKTIPYMEWYLVLENGLELYAADDHIVFNGDMREVFIKDLSKGDLVQTEDGASEVLFCYPTGEQKEMFDVEIDSEEHRYYTNGILSHNTTCAAGYLLWRAMFVPDSSILLAANKMSAAQEIMTRIRFAYENMEDNNWLRSGATEYNKTSITFANGSKITARATTPDAGRGLSISCLYLDEFAFVNPSMAAEFWTAMTPVLSTGGDCIITSTPNNDEDQFAQIWKGAINDTDDQGHTIPGGVGSNGFFPIKVTWDKHPDRDEEWAKGFRAQLGLAKFNREFNCFTGDTTVDLMDRFGWTFTDRIGDLYEKLGESQS